MTSSSRRLTRFPTQLCCDISYYRQNLKLPENHRILKSFFLDCLPVCSCSDGESSERKVLCLRDGAAAYADVRPALSHQSFGVRIVVYLWFDVSSVFAFFGVFVGAHRSEVGILTSTALLNRIIRQVTSEALLQEMVYFLLGEEKEPETPASVTRNPLRHRIIEHCDHLSDEVILIIVIRHEGDAFGEYIFLLSG